MICLPLFRFREEYIQCLCISLCVCDVNTYFFYLYDDDDCELVAIVVRNMSDHWLLLHCDTSQTGCVISCQCSCYLVLLSGSLSPCQRHLDGGQEKGLLLSNHNDLRQAGTTRKEAGRRRKEEILLYYCNITPCLPLLAATPMKSFVGRRQTTLLLLATLVYKRIAIIYRV